MLNYDGKRVLVTGASRGLGRAIAVGMATQGADVALAARSEPALADVAEQIAALGRNATVHACDLGDPDQAACLASRAADSLGGLDVVVNNAGGGPPGWGGPLHECSVNEFDATYALNVRAPFLITQAAETLLTAQGAVLNITSFAGVYATPGSAVYGSAKAALASLTESFAIEFGHRRLRVNALAPGSIETELNAERLARPGERERRTALVPLGRIGVVDDVANAALFLCSDEAEWISGATLMVAGGQLCSSGAVSWLSRHR